MSVKSDRPQPSWLVLLAEDDVLLGAVQRPPGRMRRSSVRRMPAELGMAPPDLVENGDGAKPGAPFSIGTISLSHRSASGSGRRRPRGAFFCDGSRGSCSIR